MIILVKLAVDLSTRFAYRLALAGRLSTDMIGDHLAAEVTDVILIRVLVIGNCFAAEVTDVILIRVLVVGDYLIAIVANMILACVLVVGDYLIAIVANMILACVLVVGDCLSAVVAEVVCLRPHGWRLPYRSSRRHDPYLRPHGLR